jgi:transcription initiation factor TFIIIB Brf1 subunit/transcription initiation factor TFIIB
MQLDKIRILFCQGRKQMHLNQRMTRKGMDIIQTAIMKEASAGKHPIGLAPAVIYITQLDNNIKDDIHTKGKERTQMSFAQTAGITHVTLRHSIKDLKNQLVLLN